MGDEATGLTSLAVHPLSFEIVHRSEDCAARVGRVTTLHGWFDTPAFMPVGTRGSVKGLTPGQVRETGSQIVLNNTYHLLLRPGAETVARLGGVHRFMNWDGPILTDSGGYQAFSLAEINRIDDEGVTFRSIIDGSSVRLTPEEAMRVQNLLGADIIMALDDCPPSSAEGEAKARLRAANERTVRWLERCRRAHGRREEQALFGIIQGGTDLSERSWSAERVCAMDLPGYAIGGVAVGESPEEIRRVVEHTAPLMPEDRPRYLMGVGYERDLLAAVRAGVDMFDCVLPTRNGRNAAAFTRTGQIRLRNAKFAEDGEPIEAGCDCLACRGSGEGGHFSRAYLRHLFQAGEMLGPILVSIHNLRHFQRFMGEVRGTIRSGDWGGLVDRWPVLEADKPDDGS